MKTPFNLLTLLALTACSLASTLETVSTPTKSGSSYLIRAYDGTALQLAGDVFRIPISKNSSNGDFTFLATSGEGAAQRVTPHYHLKAYETFYCQKGALNIWANGESRRLGPGDFAVVPHHVNHSYQLLEPDTLLAGVIQPGGFEDFFVNISSPYNATISTPFPAGKALDFPISAFSSASSDPKYDVYVQPNAILPSNMTNGTSSNTTPWHTGDNTLPSNSQTPYFIANNWGPKFLHSNSGSVISPLVTKETSNGNWTLSTMTFQKNGLKNKKWNFETSQAIYVLEGSLKVKVGNQSESEILIGGDLIYITPGDTFELYGDRNWAKALILGAGIESLSNELLKDSIDWAHAVGPAHKLK